MEVSVIHNEVKQNLILETKLTIHLTNQKKQALLKSITENVYAVGISEGSVTMTQGVQRPTFWTERSNIFQLDFLSPALKKCQKIFV